MSLLISLLIILLCLWVIERFYLRGGGAGIPRSAWAGATWRQ